MANQRPADSARAARCGPYSTIQDEDLMSGGREVERGYSEIEISAETPSVTRLVHNTHKSTHVCISDNAALYSKSIAHRV